MWLLNDQEFTDDFSDYIGFVYLITNLNNGRLYIGKKQFFSLTKVTRVVTLKNGTKKKKRVTKKTESDWKEYYSSSDELKSDVELFGKEQFKREILHLCKTKGTLSYLEAYEQMVRKVLETNDYYNGQIQCRIHKSHVKL